MLVQTNARLLFIGDSITDCGRARPLGRAPYGLGNGYVSLVDALLQATYPERQIEVLNVGVGGETVRDLQARWQSDVLDLQPTWLAVFIGINDVWQHFAPRRLALVSREEYAATLAALVASVRPRLAGLLLLTPYVIEPEPSDPMRSLMTSYAAVVRQLAPATDALLVDTQAVFDASMRHHAPLQLAADRIHPTLVGHTLLARAVLGALQYQWQP